MATAVREYELDKRHLCQEAFCGLQGGMRELYSQLGLLPTSTHADAMLIRSHIAYWSGSKEAESLTITPSRGHSYKVTRRCGFYRIVRISDHYDHREGVQGWHD